MKTVIIETGGALMNGEAQSRYKEKYNACCSMVGYKVITFPLFMQYWAQSTFAILHFTSYNNYGSEM